MDTDASDQAVLAAAGRLWTIPDAAWRRALGDHPPGATGTVAPFGHRGPPLSRTKRGVPVGGIGTGACMFNLCGSFGPWHMDIGGDDSAGSRWGSLKNSGFEQRYLPGAAFHVRLAGHVAGSPVVRTLATEDLLPAWSGLDVGDGLYAALFPKAWFAYDLPAPVALKQLTPFVARDERRSSLPGGLFAVAVANPTSHRLDASVLFSFPNAVYREPTEQFRYDRLGLRSRRVSAPGIVGVRLQAQHAGNPVVTERTEWVIAASGPGGATVSATEDWAADGDGADLLDAWAPTGVLPDAPVDPRGAGLGGAVAVAMALDPGEQQVATFCLAWDFPVVQFPNPVSGRRWAKRYTEWYGGGYRAWDVARDMLDDASGIESGIDGWWRALSEDATYPLWVRTAALNELYYDVFGGVFWENGCLSGPKLYGRRPGQHLFFTLESDWLRDCESFDVRHYADRHLLELFPTIERDVLLGWADGIVADPLHRTMHDAGSPVDDPWFVLGQYSATSPGEAPRRVDWLDLPAKFVQQAHNYWRYTGDDAFAAEVYPAALATMDHLLSFDLDHDGVPDATGLCTTYDDLAMVGTAVYVGALTIGACDAMADLAGSFGSPADVERFAASAATARQSVEAKLWVGSGGYYRLDDGGPNSPALLADALCGQRRSQTAGLPDVLDTARMASHLHMAYRYNVVGAGGGGIGAVNAVDPTGTIRLSPQGRGVWPGGSYFVAALMVALGNEVGDSALTAAGFDTALGVYRTTYEEDSTAFWFDTPALWIVGTDLRLHWRAPSYLRNRAAWELLAAVSDPFPPGWTAPAAS